jgi:hypothetical protein
MPLTIRRRRFSYRTPKCHRGCKDGYRALFHSSHRVGAHTQTLDVPLGDPAMRLDRTTTRRRGRRAREPHRRFSPEPHRRLCPWDASPTLLLMGRLATALSRRCVADALGPLAAAAHLGAAFRGCRSGGCDDCWTPEQPGRRRSRGGSVAGVTGLFGRLRAEIARGCTCGAGSMTRKSAAATVPGGRGRLLKMRHTRCRRRADVGADRLPGLALDAVPLLPTADDVDGAPVSISGWLAELGRRAPPTLTPIQAKPRPTPLT